MMKRLTAAAILAIALIGGQAGAAAATFTPQAHVQVTHGNDWE